MKYLIMFKIIISLAHCERGNTQDAPVSSRWAAACERWSLYWRFWTEASLIV